MTRKPTQAAIAAAIAKRKASYIAGAKSIPYNQLEKNADRHAGKPVVFRGQIMQIQEDFGSSVILLSVTDEGYGFWSDTSGSTTARSRAPKATSSPSTA